MLPRKLISYFNLRRSVIIIFTLLIIIRLCERERRSTPLPPQTQAYLEQYAQVAVDAGEETGVPPTILLAVAGLESAWGTSELAQKGNNHFGIKAEPSQPRYCLPTREFERGAFRTVKACFRSYKAGAESYRDFGRFLASKPHYKHLFGYRRSDYRRWAHGLVAGGYATDPEYAEKIIRVVQAYELDLVVDEMGEQ